MSPGEVAQWDLLVSWNLATSKVLWLFINQTCATLKNIPAWVHLRNCITELTETVIQLVEVKVNFNFSRRCRRRKATCWIKRAFSMDAVKTSLEMMYLWKIPHPHTQESVTQDKFSFNYSQDLAIMKLLIKQNICCFSYFPPPPRPSFNFGEIKQLKNFRGE